MRNEKPRFGRSEPGRGWFGALRRKNEEPSGLPRDGFRWHRIVGPFDLDYRRFVGEFEDDQRVDLVERVVGFVGGGVGLDALEAPGDLLSLALVVDLERLRYPSCPTVWIFEAEFYHDFGLGSTAIAGRIGPEAGATDTPIQATGHFAPSCQLVHTSNIKTSFRIALQAVRKLV